METRSEGKTGGQQPISEVVAIARMRTQSLKSDSQHELHFRIIWGAFKTYQHTGFTPDLLDQNLCGGDRTLASVF